MKQELIRKNFFKAVNEEWLKTAKIPADKPAWGAFSEINEKVEKILQRDLKRWVSGKKEVPDYLMLEHYVKFYQMCLDYEKREEIGAKTARQILTKIEELKDLKDLNEKYVDLVLDGFDLPVYFVIMEDFKNSAEQKLAISGPELILPEKSYYANEAQKTQLLDLYRKHTRKLLRMYGYDAKEARRLVEQAIKFDEIILPYTMSAVERADYAKLYNPYTLKEIKKHYKKLDIKKIAETLVGQEVDYISFLYPKFLENLNEIVTQKNFRYIKGWMIVNEAISLSAYLDHKTSVQGSAFSRALSGIQKPANRQKRAYYLANRTFGMVLGNYYGRKYFGEKARNNVRKMVKSMINIYEQRLQSNTWLSDETRKKAILKLEKLGVHVGYPDKLHPCTEKYLVKTYEEGGDLLTNVTRFSRIRQEYEFSQYKKPVDSELWGMSPAMVNAYYHPFLNHIVFPAAILQEPFYSLKQSQSANFGGIGAVMAHEISHAFDNNGAQFDENGNLNNWWTEKDLENFNQKAKDMIAQFDNESTEFGKCNGTLTVSENIADCGGLQCALRASQLEKNFSATDFFENFARIWRIICSEEYAKMLLAMDVHAPGELRANVQLKNIDLFHETYGLQKGDPMYLEKEKRISIW